MDSQDRNAQPTARPCKLADSRDLHVQIAPNGGRCWRFDYRFSTGTNPAQVCFEMSEDAAAGNVDFTPRFFGVLHGMGSRFAPDDLGR